MLGFLLAAVPAEAQRRSNFFDQLFGGGGFQQQPAQTDQTPQTDYSRAPAPRKPDPKAEPVVPTNSIMVMGDAMSDWLAYGLEDAFSDSPEIAVVRKNKRGSGLLRYEYKSDLDWWHVARDILVQEKADYVVMMLGLSDRQNISERDLAKEADQTDQQNAGDQPRADEPGSSIVAPEPKGKKANGVIEFRSDKWAEVYGRRIDLTIAALKSKGAPVFWVGLPAIRGPKATADAVYLNDLYRARVERAGATYIDVWDGFVDETGKFATQGPDLDGQMRRLRAWDGVYFTKAGARKLAHYVEREIRRYMSTHAVPVALPLGPAGPVPGEKSAVRPLAGPVVPLTVTLGNVNELAGGAAAPPAHGDAIATSVLVKGDPVAPAAGRADDFTWPRNGAAASASAVSAAAMAAPPPAPKVNTEIRSEPTVRPVPKPELQAKPVPQAVAKTTPSAPQATPVPVPGPKPKVVTEEKPPAPVHSHRPDFRGLFNTLFGR
jgi:hypothetical protein